MDRCPGEARLADRGGSGRPKASGYRTSQKYRPSAGAVGAPSRAVAALQDLPRPGRRRLAPPDGDQQARDIAHHVMQKGVGRRLDDDPFALPLHRRAARRAGSASATDTPRSGKR